MLRATVAAVAAFALFSTARADVQYFISNGTCPESASSLLVCRTALEAACAWDTATQRGYCCEAEQSACFRQAQACATDDTAPVQVQCGDQCCRQASERCAASGSAAPHCEPLAFANPYSNISEADANAIYVATHSARPSATRYYLTPPVMLPTATPTSTSTSSSTAALTSTTVALSMTSSVTPGMTPVMTPTPAGTPASTPTPGQSTAAAGATSGKKFQAVSLGGTIGIMSGSAAFALLIIAGAFSYDKYKQSLKVGDDHVFGGGDGYPTTLDKLSKPRHVAQYSDEVELRRAGTGF